MRDPRQTSRAPGQGFDGLADLFPHAQGQTVAKSLEQRVEPPTRQPLARSAYVAPTSYISPSAFQVPTAFGGAGARAPKTGVPVGATPTPASTPTPTPAAVPVPTPVPERPESMPATVAGLTEASTGAPVPPAVLPPRPIGVERGGAPAWPSETASSPMPPMVAGPAPASLSGTAPMTPPASASSQRVEPTWQDPAATTAPLMAEPGPPRARDESGLFQGTPGIDTPAEASAPTPSPWPSSAPEMLPPVLPSQAPATASPLPPPLLPGAQPGLPPPPIPMKPVSPTPAAPVLPPLPPAWPPQPPAAERGLRPEKSKAIPVWVWLLGGLVLVAALAFGLVQWFARYDRPGARPPTKTKTEVPAVRPSVESPQVPADPAPAPAPTPAPAPQSPEAATPVPPITVTLPPAPAPLAKPAELPPESRPPVGGEGRQFDAGQIRYCVAQNMRLNTQNKLVRPEVAKEVNRYNDLLNDYNARCRNFKYERGELQRVLAAVEADRGQIESQAKSDWMARRDEVLDEVKPVVPSSAPAPATPASPPRPKRVEPAERPLWWCLPGPENKCVPM